jgi:membrane protein DedA with SNARE-associated domain
MPSSAWVALEAWVGFFGYRGIFFALLLGSLGVPIPEEMPIVAAGALSHGGLLRWWLALPVCIAGVLSGDMVLYWTGRHWGERVLNWRVVRWVLTPQREAWLKDAYCRHAVKTVVTVRHVVGLRAAALLMAGIARVPFWKFMLADAGAALVGVPFSFGLAYFFTDQIGAILADVHRVERWLVLSGLLALGGLVIVSIVRWNRRVPNVPHAPGPRPSGEEQGPALVTTSSADDDLRRQVRARLSDNRLPMLDGPPSPIGVTRPPAHRLPPRHRTDRG